MTDRELLELAAKAAGYGFQYSDDGRLFVSGIDGIGLKEWSPLKNDGDALRLAVKLGFVVSVNRCCEKITIETGSDDDIHFYIENYEFENEDSHLSATRRAIVSAAAEIGKSINNTKV